jgi:hypothetical protein
MTRAKKRINILPNTWLSATAHINKEAGPAWALLALMVD